MKTEPKIKRVITEDNIACIKDLNESTKLLLTTEGALFIATNLPFFPAPVCICIAEDLEGFDTIVDILEHFAGHITDGEMDPLSMHPDNQPPDDNHSGCDHDHEEPQVVQPIPKHLH